MSFSADTEMTDHTELPDADFTPNPDRSILVEGRLAEALDCLRPKILELTTQNRRPITVYINSGGGISGEAILSLLRRTTPNDPRVTRLITVAAPKALSGAANLLSAGDWAIAREDSLLLYHGARWQVKELDAYWARAARALSTLHERAASLLAASCAKRFLSVVSAHRELFAEHRTANGDATLSDVQIFQAILRSKLSPAGQKALDLAIPLFQTYNGLLLRFEKTIRRGRSISVSQLQKLMLSVSLAHEYDTNKAAAWDGGLSRINESFYFLNAYFDHRQLCDWIAARAEPQTIDTEAESDMQFRLFHLALCRSLQEDEFYLSVGDALVLGLIDTIVARPAPDPEPL